MAAAKGVGSTSKRVAEVRKRKAPSDESKESKKKGAKVHKVSKAEAMVRAKLELLDGMLRSFEVELTWKAGFDAGVESCRASGGGNGFDRNLCEERLMSNGIISELDHDIVEMIDELEKQIHDLRSSKEISDDEHDVLKEEVSEVFSRYIDTCSICDDL